MVDFLRVDAQQVLSQIDQIHEFAQTLNVDIPFLSDAFDEIVGFLDTFNQQVILPLTGPVDGTTSFPSAQTLAMRLAQSLGLDPSALGFDFDAATGELTYHLHLAKDFSVSTPLGAAVDFGNGLGGLDFSSQASVDGSFALDLDFGVDLDAIADGDDPLDWFFIRDPHATAELDVSASDVDASAHIGFLSVSVVDGSLSASPTLDVTLNDPNSDGRIDLRELLDGLSDLDSLVNADLGGGANASLPIVVDVGLGGFVDPNVGTVQFSATDLFDSGTYSIDFDGDFSNVFQFNDLSAAQLLSLIGQLTGQLDALRNTEAVQAALGLPVVGPAIDSILDFGTFVHDRLLYDDVNDVPKLLDADGQPTFTTVQEFAEKLAEILGLDPSVIGANYDPVSKLLTFNLSVSEVLVGVSAPLSLDFDLAEGLADFNASTNASVDATVAFDFGFGVDLNYDPATDDLTNFVFIDDASISGSLDLTATDVDASARFGFLAIEIVDGSADAHVDFSLALNDPGSNANPASAGRIDISELIAGVSDLGTLVTPTFNASANISLPIAAPFLGITTPTAGTTMTLAWSDLTNFDTLQVDLPTGFGDLFNFTHMDAGTLVGMLGQITNWLDDFRRSFNAEDVPIIGSALDEVLKFADLFQNTLLFDDGGDGTDGADKLANDINAALTDAELGDKIFAEVQEGKISLFAIGPGIDSFTVSGNGLGFTGLRSAALNSGRLELLGTVNAPSTGILASDVLLTIAINGALGIAVNVGASATTANTGLGNDKRKLLDANNRPTFVTVQDLAQQLVHIIGLDIVNYDPATDELTLDLALGDPDSTDNLGSLDVPLDFNLLDLAPIAELTSDSAIRLSAGGGLTLTLGVYLGDVGAVQLSDATELSSLHDGITFSDLQTVAAAGSVDTRYGQLSSDASFTLSIDGGAPVTVTVPRLSGAPGTDINLTHHLDDQSETSIAVNPTNPDNIIVGVNDDDGTDGIFGSATSRDHVYVTFDGGQHWTRKTIALPASTPAPGASHGDPTIIFSRDGSIALYAHLVDKNPATHGTPAQTHVAVTAVSYDGGATWNAADTAVVGAFAADEDGGLNPSDTFPDDNDKEYLAVGPDPGDPTQDLFVLAWHRGGVIYAATSSDGLSWSTPTKVGGMDAGSSAAAPSGHSIDSMPFFGPDGQIYVAWEEYGTAGVSNLMFDSSLDGGVTWGGGLDKTIYFDTAVFALSDADKLALDPIADALNGDAQLRATIAGYTDTAGSGADNQTLSDNRAQSVFTYLTVDKGVSASQLRQLGFGETQLAVSTANDVANALNRRVEVTLDRVAYTGSVNVFNDPTSGGAYTVPAQPTRGIWMGLSADADRSGGSHDGRLYVSFADQGDLDGVSTTNHDDLDIFVITSDDGGQTWSNRVLVNNDAGNATQFFSWLDVDQSSGNVAISWYDARNDDGALGAGDIDSVVNTDVEYFAAVSFDAGQTWSSLQQQVSDAPSSPSGTGGGDYGDYTNMQFADGTLHMAWADTSDSTVIEAVNPDGALSFPDTYYDSIHLVGNSTLQDLLDSVNRALASVGLDDQVHAVLDGDRVALEALGSVTSISFNAANGSPAISQIGFRAGQAAEMAFGQLSGDATFNLMVNGAGPVAVTVPRSSTDGSAAGSRSNASVDDLADDINDALAIAGLGAQIHAITADTKIALVGLEGVTSFSLTASGGNPAVTQIGFGTSQSAASSGGVLKITATDPVDGKLRLKAAAPVSGFVGRLSGDAHFDVSLSTVNSGNPVSVTVTQESTASNRNILDVVADVQRALDAAGFADKVEVSSLGKQLVFSTREPGASGLAITAEAGSVAVEELGLAPSRTGSSADLTITTRDGSVYAVALDGLTTLGEVGSAIQTQTGGHVHFGYSDDGTRIKLTDDTTGTSTFRVSNAPGSKAKVDTTDLDLDGNTTEVFYGPNTAASDLGILGADTTDPQNDPADGEFEGGQLGGIDPLDRLFIRNAHAAASLAIADVGGLDVAAKFGFVGISAHGTGNLTGTVSVGLKPVDATGFDPDAKITLKDLIDNVSHLGDFIVGPTIDGSGAFDLSVSITPNIGIIGTSDPQLHIGIGSLAEMLDGAGDGNAGYTITTQGFDDLLNFQNIGFAQIIAALRALSDFLGGFEEFGFLNDDIPLINVSINDMLSFADQFATAVDEASRMPSRAELSGNPNLTFTSVASGPDTITRASGSWRSDRFAAGQQIRVSDSTGNDGLYTIGSVTDTVLTLVPGDALDTEGPAGNIHVRATHSDSSDSLQFLEDKLKEAFGIPATSDLLDIELVDSTILRIDLNFEPSFSESLPIDLGLELAGGAFELSGNADLRAEGELGLNLGFGIDLTNPLDVWIFGYDQASDKGTRIAGSLTAGADDISFTAALGPIGARIIGGSAEISGDFELGLQDSVFTEGSGADRRVLLGTLVDELLNAPDEVVIASLTGTIDAALPVYFPTASVYRGDIKVGGALELSIENGLDFGGTLGPNGEAGGGDQFIFVPDQLFNLDFSQFSALDNLLLIIDGVDGFLGLLQDTFDGEVGGLTLPLIGDQLADAADVIGDFRKDFIDGLRDAVETAATPDQNYISQKLFELLARPAARARRPQRRRRGHDRRHRPGHQRRCRRAGRRRPQRHLHAVEPAARRHAGRRRRGHRLRHRHSGPGTGDARRGRRRNRLAARFRLRRRHAPGLLPRRVGRERAGAQRRRHAARRGADRAPRVPAARCQQQATTTATA